MCVPLLIWHVLQLVCWWLKGAGRALVKQWHLSVRSVSEMYNLQPFPLVPISITALVSVWLCDLLILMAQHIAVQVAVARMYSECAIGMSCIPMGTSLDEALMCQCLLPSSKGNMMLN